LPRQEVVTTCRCGAVDAALDAVELSVGAGAAHQVAALEREHLADPQPTVRDHADHRLPLAGRTGERVHLGPRPDPDPAQRLLDPRIVVTDLDAHERVELGAIVLDRVLPHRREDPKDALCALRRALLLAQHVVQQISCLTAPDLVHRPVAKHHALELDVELAIHAAGVVLVRALRPRMPLQPRPPVAADRDRLRRHRPVVPLVRGVDRVLAAAPHPPRP
jgi:hypothetical protein